jgi:hypothetical protein
MKILFCSDGSSQAEIAVRFGALIAAGYQAEPSILGITEKEGDEDSLLEALRRAQEIIKEHHLDAELITKAGRPVPEIVKRTREGSYDLVVIGAVRKTTRHPLWMSVDPLWMSARAYQIIGPSSRRCWLSLAITTPCSASWCAPAADRRPTN